MSAKRRTIVAAAVAAALLLATVLLIFSLAGPDESESGGTEGPTAPSAHGTTPAEPPASTEPRSATVHPIQAAPVQPTTDGAGDSPAPRAEPERLTLRGRVVDSSGGPIAGAWIRLAALEGGGPRNSRARTDDDGVFTAGRMTAGTWRLAVTAKGYRPVVRDVELPAVQEVEVTQGVEGEVEIVLEEDPGLVVAVLDDEGHAVAGARVAIRSRSLGLPGSRSGTTLEDGTVRLSGFLLTSAGSSASAARPWSGELQVGKEGFLPESRLIDRADVDAERIEIQLGRGAELRVRVVGDDGEPVAGARVALERAANTGAASERAPVALRTTPEGEVHFPLLRPGAWRLSVTTRHDGFAPPREVVAGGDVESGPIEVRLERGPGRIVGRAVDPGGEPIVLARVRVTGSSGAAKALPAPLNGVSGADGAFVFEGLPAGEYDVVVGGGPYAPVRRERVPANGSELVVELVPPGEIAGSVTPNAALRGYSVRVRGPGYLRTFRFTARREQYVVRGVPPGVYTVEIVADGRVLDSHADVEVRTGARSDVD